MATDPAVSDKGRLLFGAGFVFGVAVTMVLVALVAATVARRAGESLLSTDVVLTIGGGIVFATIVGLSLWLLAFPENRMRLPLAGLGLDVGEDGADGSGDHGGDSSDNSVSDGAAGTAGGGPGDP